MPLSTFARRVTVALIPLGIIGCTVAVLNIPSDARIGMMVRFVMFHGASTWVNMGTITLAGVLSAIGLAGRPGAAHWGVAFRWVALPHWALNTVLGFISARLLWGSVMLNEPRMAMTLGILGAGMIVLAVQLIVDDPRTPAALDVALAVALWALILTVPNATHPDSPVFSSGDPAFRYCFFGMVLAIAVIAGALVTLVARRKKAPTP